jgi:hypothetical protein
MSSITKANRKGGICGNPVHLRCFSVPSLGKWRSQGEILAERGVIVAGSGVIDPADGEICADSPGIVPATGEIVAARGEINAAYGRIVAAGGVIETERGLIETERGRIVPERGRMISASGGIASPLLKESEASGLYQSVAWQSSCSPSSLHWRMDVKPNARIAALSIGLLTAVAAGFGLGRITAPDAVRGSSKAPASAAHSATAPFRPDQSGADPSEAALSLEGWFGSRATSIDEVIGERSLQEHVLHLLGVEDEAVRMLGFLRLMEAMKSPDEIKAALDVIGSQRNSRVRLTEQAMLLQKWAQLDTKGAAGYASAMRDWARFNGLNAVMQQWVKSDPESAIAWANQNGMPSGGEDARRDNEEGNWAVATLMGSLARTSLDRAIQLAAEQPASRARGRMIDTVINELVAQRGEEAARNALLNLPDDPFRAGMAGELAERYANADPAAAAKWASNLPAGDTRQRAIAEAVAQWADKDAIAAGTYLQTLGSSPVYDDARQRYAYEVVRKDPEGALTWALAIADETQRTQSIQGLLRDWMRRDAATAQAWAAANGIAVSARGERVRQ